MRLIDADRLKQRMLAQDWKDDTTLQLALQWIYILIDEEPAIEPKRGEWIDCNWFDEHYGHCYECNACKKSVIGRQNFCPNCGADMRKNEKE